MAGRTLMLGFVALAASAAAPLGLAQDAPANRTADQPSSVAAPAADLTAVPPPDEGPSVNETASSDDNTSTEANEVAVPPPAPAAAPPVPLKRPKYTTAVLQTLDKVTAETLRFEAKVNEPVRYKDLVITVHACETTAADEDFSDSMAQLEVEYQPDVLPGRAPETARQVFRGWMFANSPGLNPFQHPIYDVWVIACRTPAPAEPAPASTGASL